MRRAASCSRADGEVDGAPRSVGVCVATDVVVEEESAARVLVVEARVVEVTAVELDPPHAAATSAKAPTRRTASCRCGPPLRPDLLSTAPKGRPSDPTTAARGSGITKRATGGADHIATVVTANSSAQ